MASYYKPSGRYSPFSIFLLLVLCVTVIPVLALIYAFATWYIPIVYLNIILGAGMGWLVGWLVYKFVIRLGKVRNGLIATLWGLIAGLATLYFSWVWWLDILNTVASAESYPGFMDVLKNFSFVDALSLTLNPSGVFEIIGNINEVGTWGVKSSNLVNGTPLTIVWLIEAAILTLIPILYTFGTSGEPFCEDTQSWAEPKALSAVLPIDSQGFIQSLDNGERPTLEVLNLETLEEAVPFTSMLMHQTNGGKFYLSASSQIPKVGKNDEIEYEASELFEYLEINEEFANELSALS